MGSARSVLRDHPGLLSLISRVLDGLAIVACASIGYIWRFSLDEFPAPTSYHAIVLIAVLLAMIIFPWFGVYASWRGRSLFNLFSRILTAWSVVMLTLISLLFLAKAGADYSRVWFITWAGTTVFALIAIRVAIHQGLRLMRRRGWNHKRVVVAGAGRLGKEVVRRLSHVPEAGLDVAGLLDDNEALWGQQVEGATVLGSLDRLGEVVASEHVDEVWIALPLKAEPRVNELLHQLRHSTVNVRFVPDIFGFRLLNHSITDIAGMPVLNLNLSPMSGLNRVLKAVEDRVLALIILLLITPLLLLIGLGVRLSSPGPIVFKQRRHGWDGRPIKVYKFRTMRVHEDDGQVTQARRNDSRVTPFGAFLRRTSLDELPQFFNVLQGRMSIVGPRPHAVEHNEFYKELIDAYMLRHKVKPGITGWAQVNGWRGETDTLEKMKKRIECDLYYIENWSVLLDLKIIMLTVYKGFLHKNAY